MSSQTPSTHLHSNHKLLEQVFQVSDHDPIENVVWDTGYKDRLQTTGRRRRGKIPYWIEVTTKRMFKVQWDQNPGRGILGANTVYVSISGPLRSTSIYLRANAVSKHAHRAVAKSNFGIESSQRDCKVPTKESILFISRIPK